MPRIEPSAELDQIGSAIVDSAFRIHAALGPGLLESVYELCFEHEMKSRGFVARRQVPVPVRYGAVELKATFGRGVMLPMAPPKAKAPKPTSMMIP